MRFVPSDFSGFRRIDLLRRECPNRVWGVGRQIAWDYDSHSKRATGVDDEEEKDHQGNHDNERGPTRIENDVPDADVGMGESQLLGGVGKREIGKQHEQEVIRGTSNPVSALSKWKCMGAARKADRSS